MVIFLLPMQIAEIYEDFTKVYRIVIAYIEIEIGIIYQTHVFSGYKSLFVRPGIMHHVQVLSEVAFPF